MTTTPRNGDEPAMRDLETRASAGLRALGERRRQGRIGADEYRRLRHQLLAALRRDLAAAVAVPPVPSPDAADSEPLPALAPQSSPRQSPGWQRVVWIAVMLGLIAIIAMLAQR